MHPGEQGDDVGLLPYNYFIVGVQKSGTTTLSNAIVKHPLVCPAPTKEAHFFNNEDYDWSAPNYERDFVAPRRHPHQRLVGDATPLYLFWPGAMERIRAYKPDVPLIAVFRDPIERTFSHWAMLKGRTPDWDDWPAFIHEFRPTTLPTEVPQGVRPLRFKNMSGVARGYYGQQLARGLELFPREQWLLLEFRDMVARFDEVMKEVTDHLSLPPFTSPPEVQHGYQGPGQVTGTAPTADDVQALAELYAADLEEFERLSGLDTSHWPTARILAGQFDPGELAAKFASRVTFTPAG